MFLDEQSRLLSSHLEIAELTIELESNTRSCLPSSHIQPTHKVTSNCAALQ
jgi:hypothetical protein